MPLDVWIALRQHGVYVPAVPRLIDPFRGGHVLRGHPGCSIAYRPCSSPKKVKRLDDGKHKFKVIATDEAGNSDASAANDKFKVVD